MHRLDRTTATHRGRGGSRPHQALLRSRLDRKDEAQRRGDCHRVGEARFPGNFRHRRARGNRERHRRSVMRFGIHNSSWLDTPDPAEAFEAVKVKAQWAENHGFVWFSVLDHMIQIPRVGAPDEPFLEGWTVLAGLAAVTSRIRLATLATAVGYRNPAHLAKIAASVDLISRGRLTLGIGAGFFEDEYKQYGWEFPPQPATRIRQMEEAVQLVTSQMARRSPFGNILDGATPALDCPLAL